MFFASNHHFGTPNLQILMCFWKIFVRESDIALVVLFLIMDLRFFSINWRKNNFSSGPNSKIIGYYLQISSKTKSILNNSKSAFRSHFYRFIEKNLWKMVWFKIVLYPELASGAVANRSMKKVEFSRISITLPFLNPITWRTLEKIN